MFPFSPDSPHFEVHSIKIFNILKLLVVTYWCKYKLDQNHVVVKTRGDEFSDSHLRPEMHAMAIMVKIARQLAIIIGCDLESGDFGKMAML